MYKESFATLDEEEFDCSYCRFPPEIALDLKAPLQVLEVPRIGIH